MKGSLEQRSKGAWRVRVDLGNDTQGKRKQLSFTVRGTKRDAERELARRIHEIETGQHVAPVKLRVADYLRQWLAEYARPKLEAKTCATYEEFVEKHLIPALGHHQLTKLTPLHIQSYYTHALEHGRRDGKGGLSRQTVLHHHRVLRKALQQAVKWQLLSRNPADAADAPKPARKEMQVFTRSEWERLLAEAKGTRLYVPVLLALTTGMRRGEILGLRWQDVDLKAGTLAVRQSLSQVKGQLIFKSPKSGKSRLITLPGVTVDELVKHQAKQAQQKVIRGDRYDDNGLVVCNADGSPLSPNALTHAYTDLVVKAGLPAICFHGLRHTHATFLLSVRTHPKVVSERLGHSKIGITLDTYSHVIPNMQEEAARALDGAFRPAGSGLEHNSRGLKTGSGSVRDQSVTTSPQATAWNAA